MSKLTPDLSEFEERHAQRTDKCLIGRHLDELAEQDRVNVTAALANPKYTHTSIATYLSRRGHPTSDHSIRQHRNQRCCCAKASANA